MLWILHQNDIFQADVRAASQGAGWLLSAELKAVTHRGWATVSNASRPDVGYRSAAVCYAPDI